MTRMSSEELKYLSAYCAAIGELEWVVFAKAEITAQNIGVPTYFYRIELEDKSEMLPLQLRVSTSKI